MPGDVIRREKHIDNTCYQKPKDKVWGHFFQEIKRYDSNSFYGF
jgi:hypothetical protein